MRSQSILVLGAGGFVGKHLIKRLSQEAGRKVYAVGHHAAPLTYLPNVHFHQTNIDDEDLLHRVLPECSHVFHLACASTPGSSALSPVFEAENNLSPTLRFLEILQKYPFAHLIYLSSGGALYGNIDPKISFVQENTPPAPLSYYGAGKAALEYFVNALCNQQQRSGIILRPANFYGPHQTHKPGFGIVPTIFHGITHGKPLQIWGDGENVRDYIFIDDFIELCLNLVNSSHGFNHVKIYNVGSQQGTSLNQLCKLIEKVVGTSVPREYHVSRSIDVNRVVLNCNQVYKDYRWKAHTDLLTGLRLTWKWHTKGIHRDSKTGFI